MFCIDYGQGIIMLATTEVTAITAATRVLFPDSTIWITKTEETERKVSILPKKENMKRFF